MSFWSNGYSTTWQQMPTELSNKYQDTLQPMLTHICMTYTHMCFNPTHRLSTTSWLATYASPLQPMLAPATYARTYLY
jgi:hypothetical protein